MKTSPLYLLALAAAWLVVLPGCTPSHDAAPADLGASQAPAAATQADGIEVTAPWLRQPVMPGGVAGGYLTVHNAGAQADRLLAVETQAAERVEIHEMQDVDGVMRMRQLEDGLPIPAGGEVALAPGGYHLMLMSTRTDLAAGQQVAATLVFEHAGRVPVQFDIRGPDGAPTGDDATHHAH